jgi:hypothetical protein
MKMETESLVETYHKPPGSQDLLARDGVDDGEVAFCADHYQNEDGGCVTEAVHELVHLTQRVPKHPAARDMRNILGLHG